MTVKQRRRQLLVALGGKCAQCGATRALQFDHIKARSWVPSRFSKERRMRTYERAAKAGKLQLLCKECHGAKSAREGRGYDPLTRLVRWLSDKSDRPF